MKKRVLIVEDDHIAFSIAKVFFEKFDCDVDHAPSGESALELYAQALLAEHPYDAIYLDLGLPKMNGIEVCLKIREYETEVAMTPVPMMAVTANEHPLVVDECLAAGMMAVNFKPLTPQNIADFLAKWCS